MINGSLRFLPYFKLQDLINTLIQDGYMCVGPQVKNGAILYDTLNDVAQLPWGVIDHQTPGSYLLEHTNLPGAFAWTNGPQAIKPYLFNSYETIYCAEKNLDDRLLFQHQKKKPIPIAFIGARSCDLAAMSIQDKIFLGDLHVNPFYQTRRENFFVIAVNCTRCSANCFCVSTGDGPRAAKFFDLAMTEIDDGFIVEIGSEKGKHILEPLNLPSTQLKQITQAEINITNAALGQLKKMPPVYLRDLLFDNLNHWHWSHVSQKCLSCAHCIRVCPTCFCQCVVESPGLDGTQSLPREQSYIYGNLICDNTCKRYRQWLTHKEGGCYDQFGRSGCVGCGRCITWCPAGVDITVELKSIYENKEKSLSKIESSFN